MIDKKTGSLLGASSALPIVYDNADKELINIYEQFGRHLGRGFQIHDDLLEITADSKVMGKSLGSDIFQGKQTIMVILARENYPDEWAELLNNSDSNELFGAISYFFQEKNIIQETRSISESYFSSSLNYLRQLNKINTDELVQLVHLIKERTY